MIAKVNGKWWSYDDENVTEVLTISNNLPSSVISAALPPVVAPATVKLVVLCTLQPHVTP